MFRSFPCKLSLLAVMGVALAAASHADTLSASANLAFDHASHGVYDYSITLDNTGTTTIGTFWFSWIPGAGFLSATPTDVTWPTGWNEKVTNGGKSIQWTTSTNLLNPGSTLSGFNFESTETPAELLLTYTGTGTGAGDPVLTSTVYSGAPFSSSPYIFTVAETPEPNTLLLTLTGLGLVAGSLKSRFLRRS